MSYYPKGHRDGEDDVDDFDEFDPTPYGGGYDIELTYGRAIPPSEETSYPNESGSLDFDYDRPQYNFYDAEPSAYADDALETEYKSYTRPARRPGGGRRPDREEYGEERRPSYDRSEEDEYRRPRRDDDDDDEYRKPRRGRRGDDDDDGEDEGYGRKKYGEDSEGDDEDEERKHRRRHNRKHYDDE